MVVGAPMMLSGWSELSFEGEAVEENVDEDVAAALCLALLGAVGVAEHKGDLLHVLRAVGDAEVGSDVADVEGVGVGGGLGEAVLGGVGGLVVAAFGPRGHDIFPVGVVGAAAGDDAYVGVDIGSRSEVFKTVVAQGRCGIVGEDYALAAFLQGRRRAGDNLLGQGRSDAEEHERN